ncbi:MAG: hypothetical protein JWR04_981 [Rhodoglobus sp.]|nr:hypothetical protein [Rhodoglobus sp.]
MNVRGTLTVLVAVLALSGCSLLPAPGPVVTPETSTPTAEAVQDGPPLDSEIVTLTPEQVLPEDVYTRSEPNGSFPMGADLPRGFPAGVPAFANRWVKSNFLSFVNSDGRKSYSAMFVGGYDDVDALLAEFARQGWSEEGSDELPTRRVYIVQNAAYRVIITASESAQSQGEPIDPAYSYTIVVL